jgi:tRNA(adenine34) deaminase
MVELSLNDISCFQRAIQLAHQAEQEGNLPIGAVISLNGKIIAEGRNAIWVPQLSPDRHAEMEACRNVPNELWSASREMTLYSTLEPCLMCLGAILLHRIGRVLYGAADDYGGADRVRSNLPDFFDQEASRIAWVGPVYTMQCDVLFERVMQLVERWQGQGYK